MPHCESPAAVTPRLQTMGRDHLLWPADRRRPRPEWFDAHWYRAEGLDRGEGLGRGSTLYAELDEVDVVLRHYRRGGALRDRLGDRYVWRGLQATRAWRELALLARLQHAGLPVPAPVAARVQRLPSPFYRADLLTERLPQTRTLSQALASAPLDAGVWRAVGETIARFHRAGVEHADLNAHNILLDAHGAVYLIDFDRGRLRRRTGRWCGRNLRRLHRSLRKLSALEPRFHFEAAAWADLIDGYDPAKTGRTGRGRGAW